MRFLERKINFLETEPKLKNRYFGQRHGQSLANLEDILLSNLPDGTIGYGLTEEGRKQVTQAAEAAKADPNGPGKNRPLLFVVSPFKRAIETAQISQSILGGFIVTSEDLKERYFGKKFDKKTAGNLKTTIWPNDEDGKDSDFGVTSLQSVKKRTTKLIRQIEQNFEGYDVVLVSHGDTLQILQTAFMQIDPSMHRRSVRHVGNGEFRRFHLWRKLKAAEDGHVH